MEFTPAAPIDTDTTFPLSPEHLKSVIPGLVSAETSFDKRVCHVATGSLQGDDAFPERVAFPTKCGGMCARKAGNKYVAAHDVIMNRLGNFRRSLCKPSRFPMEDVIGACYVTSAMSPTEVPDHIFFASWTIARGHYQTDAPQFVFISMRPLSPLTSLDLGGVLLKTERSAYIDSMASAHRGLKSESGGLHAFTESGWIDWLFMRASSLNVRCVKRIRIRRVGWKLHSSIDIVELLADIGAVLHVDVDDLSFDAPPPKEKKRKPGNDFFKGINLPALPAPPPVGGHCDEGVEGVDHGDDGDGIADDPEVQCLKDVLEEDEVLRDDHASDAGVHVMQPYYHSKIITRWARGHIVVEPIAYELWQMPKQGCVLRGAVSTCNTRSTS
jgi:hypothetical protein